jgi:hypothetical protein
MSNPYEPEMTKAYWARRPESGTLYLEYPIHGRRIDGLVVVDNPAQGKTVVDKGPYPELETLRGKKLIVLQTKRKKLGMGLAGQTIISKTLLLIEGFKDAEVEAVAICLELDAKIQEALAKHGCEAVVEADPKTLKQNPD